MHFIIVLIRPYFIKLQNHKRVIHNSICQYSCRIQFIHKIMKSPKISKSMSKLKPSKILTQITNTSRSIGGGMNLQLNNEEHEEISFENFIAQISQNSGCKSRNKSSLSNSPIKSQKFGGVLVHNFQLQVEMKKLEGQNKRLIQRNNRQELKYAGLKKQYGKIRENKQKLEEQLRKLQDKNKKTIKQIKQKYQQSLEAIKNKQNAVRQQTIKQIKNNASQSILQLQNQLKSKDQQVATSTQKSDQLQQHVRKLKDDLQELNKCDQIKQKQITKYQEIIKERSEYYDQLLVAKDKEIGELRNQIKSLSLQFNQNKKECIQQIEQLNCHIEQLQQSMDNLSDLCKQYQNGFTQLGSLIQTSKQHLYMKHKRISLPGKLNFLSSFMTMEPADVCNFIKKQLISYIQLSNQLIQQSNVAPKQNNVVFDDNEKVTGNKGRSKNISNCSLQKLQSENEVAYGLLPKEINDNKNFERQINVLNSQKNIFTMKLRALKRQRSYHSIDGYPKQQEYEAEPTQQHICSSFNRTTSNFNSKSTRYFINQTNVIPQANKRQSAVIEDVSFKDHSRTKIREQIENAKKILQGTYLKSQILANDLSKGHKKRGSSLPNLKIKSALRIPVRKGNFFI